MPSFLETFDLHWREKLAFRAETFRKALELLQQRPHQHVICETGCMRVEPTQEAARNDGSSTMLVGRIPPTTATALSTRAS